MALPKKLTVKDLARFRADWESGSLNKSAIARKYGLNNSTNADNLAKRNGYEWKAVNRVINDAIEIVHKEGIEVYGKSAAIAAVNHADKYLEDTAYIDGEVMNVLRALPKMSVFNDPNLKDDEIVKAAQKIRIGAEYLKALDSGANIKRKRLEVVASILMIDIKPKNNEADFANIGSEELRQALLIGENTAN